jgi:SAM-dependent methyltransferase
VELPRLAIAQSRTSGWERNQAAPTALLNYLRIHQAVKYFQGHMLISGSTGAGALTQQDSQLGKVQPAAAGLPPFDMRGKKVLEVGCATGVDLTHQAYAEAAERCGIDVDVNAIRAGRAQYPALDLRVARGEAIPFEDGYFDAVLSRIALPYMDIPAALSEFHRVMRPGGYLFVSWHDWKGRDEWFGGLLRGIAWKRATDLAYIITASLAYRLLGRIPARPWNGTRETFQFKRHIPLILAAAGFVDVACERTEHHLRTTARKPVAPNEPGEHGTLVH